MGKTELCIKMLRILNDGQVHQIFELANRLETNPRNIIEYKKELDMIAWDPDNPSGFFIESIPGRYGGYRLVGHAVIPSLKLNEKERNAVIAGNTYLTKRNDFLEKKEYLDAMSKIISSISMNEVEYQDRLLIINRFPLVMDEEELRYRFFEIKKAIYNKKKIIIKYLSSKNIEKEHLFDPYELFMYNNTWYVIGWLNSLEHADICWFKINRIKEIKTTDKSFKVWKGYLKSNYIDEYGFKTNGDWYHLIFIAHGPYASLVKERIYGKNQIVEPIDENSTRVSVDMQNEENIKAFILGFGANIDVIEPEWLKEELSSIAKEIINKYQK